MTSVSSGPKSARAGIAQATMATTSSQRTAIRRRRIAREPLFECEQMLLERRVEPQLGARVFAG